MTRNIFFIVKFSNVMFVFLSFAKYFLIAWCMIVITKNIITKRNLLNNTLSIKKSSFFLIKKFFPDRNISRRNSKTSIFIAFSLTINYYAHRLMKSSNSRIISAHFNASTIIKNEYISKMLWDSEISRFSSSSSLSADQNLISTHFRIFC